jgi:hypothetical protein
MTLTASAKIDKDWFGTPVAARPQFELGLDAGDIVLRGRAEKAPLVVPGDTGGYAEGLWNGDCVELFLVNPETGYYIEFNLSPKGGRWSCEFTAPRVRAPGAPRDFVGVSTTAKRTDGAWESTIRIPVASLPAELAFDPAKTRGNVTFCLGDSHQLYLTYADLGDGMPNFHRPDHWIRLFA